MARVNKRSSRYVSCEKRRKALWSANGLLPRVTVHHCVVAFSSLVWLLGS